MTSFSRRNFLKSTGLVGGGMVVFGSMLSKNLFASARSLGLPFYKQGAPFSQDLRRDAGESVTLQGVVYQHDGKTRLYNAVVELWHCDAKGKFDYSNQYLYRGKTLTDKNGKYTIKTNFPGRYKENGYFKMGRIFILVNGPGHQESFSQLYFDLQKNPYIDNKHWAACPMAERPSLPKRNQSIITYDHYLNKHPLCLVPDAKELAESQTRIYPNHLRKESYLTFGKLRPGNVSIRLMNTKQQVAQNLWFKDVKPEQSLPIDHQNLDAGDYTCSIYSSRLGSFSRKLKIG